MKEETQRPLPDLLASFCSFQTRFKRDDNSAQVQRRKRLVLLGVVFETWGAILKALFQSDC